jgi:hypothetical protein
MHHTNMYDCYRRLLMLPIGKFLTDGARFKNEAKAFSAFTKNIAPLGCQNDTAHLVFLWPLQHGPRPPIVPQQLIAHPSSYPIR